MSHHFWGGILGEVIALHHLPTPIPSLPAGRGVSSSLVGEGFREGLSLGIIYPPPSPPCSQGGE